ncbi:MAG TPA: hypothetical protein VN788_13940 [Verrucomicrobiae bacterium]|nr:hypothetical protein [Verrucomicrobiae bacterium]
MTIHQRHPQIVLADCVNMLSIFDGSGSRGSGGFSLRTAGVLNTLASGGQSTGEYQKSSRWSKVPIHRIRAGIRGAGPLAGTPGAFYRIRCRGLGILPCRKSLRDVRNKAPRAQISGSLKVTLRYDAGEPLRKIEMRGTLIFGKAAAEGTLG